MSGENRISSNASLPSSSSSSSVATSSPTPRATPNATAAREYHFTREIDIEGSAAHRAPLGVRCPRCREVKGLDCCQESPCPCTCHIIERAAVSSGLAHDAVDTMVREWGGGQDTERQFRAELETLLVDVRGETIEACAKLVETLPTMGLREVAARLRASQFTSPAPKEKP